MGSRKSKVECPTTELTDKQIREICRRTNLTESEVRQRHLQFLDQFPDGLITREELYESLCEVWPEGRIEKFASHLFAILDQDHSGTIDFVEFFVLTHKLDFTAFDQSMDDNNILFGLIFDMFDRNHNGYLEKNELKPMIKSIYDLAGSSEKSRHGKYSVDAQAKYILKKLDTNGDKRVSKEEFLDRDKWANDERLEHFLFSC